MSQTTTHLRPVLVMPALLLLAATSGCGQKGPLYLPDNPSEMQTIEAPARAPGESGAVPAPEDDDVEGDDNDEPGAAG